MKSADANLNSLQTQQPSPEEPEPSNLSQIQELIIVLSKVLSKKYGIKDDYAIQFAENKFKKLKELAELNPDKVERVFKIYPISDANICKYLIEKGK